MVYHIICGLYFIVLKVYMKCKIKYKNYNSEEHPPLLLAICATRVFLLDGSIDVVFVMASLIALMNAFPEREEHVLTSQNILNLTNSLTKTFSRFQNPSLYVSNQSFKRFLGLFIHRDLEVNHYMASLGGKFLLKLLYRICTIHYQFIHHIHKSNFKSNPNMGELGQIKMSNSMSNWSKWPIMNINFHSNWWPGEVHRGHGGCKNNGVFLFELWVMFVTSGYFLAITQTWWNINSFFMSFWGLRY